MSTALQRRNRPRRGVTLVEMLVVVALVVLMMVILVQIFQSALGAMSASRTTQELDVVLRQIDSMIRSDLAGVTAKLTPPNNPALKQGYFEYGENAPADLQGEDTDDFLAFTTKAPEGQFFTGRQWLSTTNVPTNPQLVNQAIQPATVTSQVAEVIYFVRNGNLYRRVFLVSPERKSSIYVGTSNGGGFQTSIFGGSAALPVSWLGMNEISCRPSLTGTPIPNDLGDLTNRENRAFRPRFWNDYSSPNNSANPGAQDGIPDDINGDDIPDYYPTLYYDGVGHGPTVGWTPNSFVYEDPNLPYPQNNQRIAQSSSGNSYDVYAFPYIYPGMYSVPDPNRVNTPLGWVHYVTNSTSAYLNHSPLDLSESPGFTLPATSTATNPYQTWWGFPTWRESMAGGSSGSGWYDPVFSLANNRQQPLGLKPFNPTVSPALNSPTFLTPVSNFVSGLPPYGYDGAGSASFVADPVSAANPYGPNVVWQDDLILTNVRSFDVKAYDPNAPLYDASVFNSSGVRGAYLSAGYWDLGYAGLTSDTYAPNTANTNATIYGPNGSGFNTNSQVSVPWQPSGSEPQGFGHEGRIPPYQGDFRLHPRRGYNIGDNSNGVIRLTHTFDTWSTDYVNAPDSDLLLWEYSSTSQAIYPSFNAPYPSPLAGIQIQIRVTDPRNERTKVLTIRHDFTDKL